MCSSHLNCAHGDFGPFLTACIHICFCCQQTQNVLNISISEKFIVTLVLQTTLHFLKCKHLQVLPMFSRFLLEAIYYPLSQMYLERVVFKLHVSFPSRTYQVIALFSTKLILYSKNQDKCDDT